MLFSLALTVLGEYSKTRTVVNESYFTLKYNYRYDAGVSTGFWGPENRVAGNPTLPMNPLPPTLSYYHSYGITIYSYFSASFFLEFFDYYQL